MKHQRVGLWKGFPVWCSFVKSPPLDSVLIACINEQVSSPLGVNNFIYDFFSFFYFNVVVKTGAAVVLAEAN